MPVATGGGSPLRTAAAAPNTTAAPDAQTSATRGDTTGGTPTAGYAAAAAIYNPAGENDSRARVCADVNLLVADVAALRTTVVALRAELHDLKDKLRAADVIAE